NVVGPGSRRPEQFIYNTQVLEFQESSVLRMFGDAVELNPDLLFGFVPFGDLQLVKLQSQCLRNKQPQLGHLHAPPPSNAFSGSILEKVRCPAIQDESLSSYMKHKKQEVTVHHHILKGVRGRQDKEEEEAGQEKEGEEAGARQRGEKEDVEMTRDSLIAKAQHGKGIKLSQNTVQEQTARDPGDDSTKMLLTKDGQRTAAFIWTDRGENSDDETLTEATLGKSCA
ncbi:hypothetical protein STEG23_023581, partial [Scotinomys teguina]